MWELRWSWWRLLLHSYLSYLKYIYYKTNTDKVARSTSVLPCSMANPGMWFHMGNCSDTKFAGTFLGMSEIQGSLHCIVPGTITRQVQYKICIIQVDFMGIKVNSYRNTKMSRFVLLCKKKMEENEGEKSLLPFLQRDWKVRPNCELRWIFNGNPGDAQQWSHLQTSSSQCQEFLLERPFQRNVHVFGYSHWACVSLSSWPLFCKRLVLCLQMHPNKYRKESRKLYLSWLVLLASFKKSEGTK